MRRGCRLEGGPLLLGPAGGAPAGSLGCRVRAWSPLGVAPTSRKVGPAGNSWGRFLRYPEGYFLVSSLFFIEFLWDVKRLIRI